MKVKQKKFQTRQQAEWAAFCDANTRQEQQAVFAQMTDSGNRNQAKRVMNGPSAAQKRESAARQAAVNNERAVSREVAFMMRD